MTRKINTCVFALAGLLLFACRGGGSDPFAVPAIGGSGGKLVCPEPGSLPFKTESQTFENAKTAAQAQSVGIVNHYILDFLGLPGDAQVIRGQATYGLDALQVLNGGVPAGLPNEWVSLWYQDQEKNWKQLGRVQTDSDGVWEVTLGKENLFDAGAYRVYAVVEGDATCAVGGVFVYPQGTQFVVTDLDETMTIADAEVMSQLEDPAYIPVANDGAIDMMKKYHEKGYEIMYLTARPFHLRMFSRRWNDHVGLPFGYIETANKFVFDASAVAYKAGFLIDLLTRKEYSIRAIYGNANSDIDAYDEVGIPKNVTFIVGKNAGNKGTVPIAEKVDTANGEIYSFRKHTAEYVDLEVKEANQPF